MKKIHLAWGIAATVLLVAGLAVGRSWPEKPAPAEQESSSGPAASDRRPLFALMLYEDASYMAAGSHEDRVAEYTAWARSLGERGYLVDGAELASNGVLLAPTQPRVDAVPTSSQGVHGLQGQMPWPGAVVQDGARVPALEVPGNDLAATDRDVSAASSVRPEPTDVP